MRKVLLVCFLFSASVMNAQMNLVPNGDFEDSVICTMSSGVMPANWYPPSFGSPDYYGIYTTIAGCTLANTFWGGGGIPFGYGYQWPHSGTHYAGFNSGMNGREYMAVKLADSLMPGKKYCLEFYVSLTENSQMSSDGLGISLSNDSIHYYQYGASPVPGLVFTAGNPTGNQLADTTNWMMVRDSFIAVGGEKYLMFGNIRSDAQTTFAPTGVTSGNPCYYYVDDISLFFCDSIDSVVEPVYSSFTLFPNPSSGNFQLTGNFPADAVFHVYDLLGQEVSEPVEMPEGNKSVSVSLNLADGIYFYRIISGKEILHEEKIVIVK
ncbi:MAG: T9SS type A sorting domain-containing protein [Bacteroidetes bacterium]|nr:T9SS type A sorting domain-containing protein [Bacteroidota bacterium]